VLKSHIRLENHAKRFDIHIMNQLKNRSYYYGRDEEGDPVVDGLLDTYEEDAEMRDSIENQHPYGFDERTNARKRRSERGRTEDISSDEEHMHLKEER